MSRRNNETLITELNQLNQSFMYTQILKEILFDKKSIKDFIIYYRNQFANNEKELNIINEFEWKYLKFKPIFGGILMNVFCIVCLIELYVW